MKKPFKVALVRDLINEHGNEGITLSRYVEQLNEIAEVKFTPEEIKELVDTYVERWHNLNPTLDKGLYWSAVNDGVYLIINHLKHEQPY